MVRILYKRNDVRADLRVCPSNIYITFYIGADTSPAPTLCIHYYVSFLFYSLPPNTNFLIKITPASTNTAIPAANA